MPISKVYGQIAVICLLVLANDASAHHSTNANYDKGSTFELEGEITRVLWRNPHVRFSISVQRDDGLDEQWHIEATSVTHLRNQDVTKVLLEIGEKVKLAGHPSKRGLQTMWVTNILLSNGRELVTEPHVKPRWSDQVLGKSGPRFVTEGDASNPGRGIFGVWAHTAVVPMLFPSTRDPNFDVTSYPMTDEARVALAAYDPLADDPTANCAPKGMPTIMEQPYPLEIVEDGQDILIRLEEYDTVRTIHMGTEATPDGQTATRLGYSAGRWDGSVLVVTTSLINWKYFNQTGVPLTESATIEERFSPKEDGSRLDYRMTVEDPAIFTEPVTLQKYWLNVPGVTVQPYKCTTG
jgi:hypothetical protein